MVAKDLKKINIKKIHPGISWVRVASRGRLHAILYLENVGLATTNRSDLSEYKINCPADYYRQFDGSRWISEKDYKNIMAFYEKAIVNNAGFIGQIADARIKINQRLMKLAARYKHQGWKIMSNEKLIDILGRWQYLEGAHWGGVWVYGYYIYINEVFLEKFKNYLEKKFPKNFADIWNYILSPSRISEIGREKIDLLKLALVSLQRPVTEVMVVRHVKKYDFTNKYYFWGDKLDAQKVKNNLHKYASKGKKFIEAEFEKMKPPKINLNKYGLSKKDKVIIEGLRKISFSLSQNDDTSNYLICRLEPFFNELATRLGLTYDEVVSLRGAEIRESLRNGRLAIARRELKLRLKDHAFIFSKSKAYILVGKELAEYQKQELKKQIFKSVKELKGVVASPGGVITGRVKIIDSDKKVSSFKNNEILVTQMTNPAFVPAMKKAAAIITDEGGLLSHAAIVSRELGAPCIVGTKIATKVLKDGQLVEVDANKGVVRILKRK